MTTKNIKWLLSLTSTSAACGLFLAVVYVVNNEQQQVLPVLLTFVAIACLLGMLFGWLLIVLTRIFKTLVGFYPKRGQTQSSMPDEWEKIDMRRQMIERRLAVDESRFCARRGVSCDCWSFCGGDSEVHSDGFSASANKPVSFVPKRKTDLVTNLPIIEDRNVDDCTVK